ncbi:MAG TPA: hypothetical protein VL563_09905 [Gemmatimonadales bacterium]|jgi:hypothetical protein|nr:hypothetical protein [Gemmatimonadales bacterium]
MDGSQLKRLADIAVDVVHPEGNGFALSGQGSDRAEYRLDVHFDMPLDGRTRAVLGGLLAQSELTLWRRSPAGTPARRERAHRSRRRGVTAD